MQRTTSSLFLHVTGEIRFQYEEAVDLVVWEHIRCVQSLATLEHQFEVGFLQTLLRVPEENIAVAFLPEKYPRGSVRSYVNVGTGLFSNIWKI